MPKVILYLDQNFVSNMAKARAGIIKDDAWLHLYNLLDDLVHNKQRVICPESFLHESESSLSKDLSPLINEVVIHLSWGLKLIPWQDALQNQVYRAMGRFLGKKEDPPHWSQAFTHDPHEPTSRRSSGLRGGSFLVHRPWGRLPEFIERDERAKKQYPIVMPVPINHQRGWRKAGMILKQCLIGLALVWVVVLAVPVIAASGWLLLAPPYSQGSADQFNVEAPVNQWRQMQAFDSAFECERGKQIREQMAAPPKDPITGLPLNLFRDHPRTLMDNIRESLREADEKELRYAKCVPADAVYRAPK